MDNLIVIATNRQDWMFFNYKIKSKNLEYINCLDITNESFSKIIAILSYDDDKKLYKRAFFIAP